MESSEEGGPSQVDISQSQGTKGPDTLQPSKANIAEAKQQAAEKAGLHRLADVRKRLVGFDSVFSTRPQPPNTSPSMARVADGLNNTNALRQLTRSSQSSAKPEQVTAHNRSDVPQPGEVRASPDAIESVKELATQVEDVIRAAYGISNAGLARVADSFWNGGDNELRELLAKYRLKELNPMGANYVLDAKGWHSSIVYLAPDLIERLARSNPAELLVDPTVRRDFAALIEEVSHFTYDAYYRKLYGVKPHSALVEMVAVLDEYNVFQYLTRLTQGRVLNTQEHLISLRYNEAAYNQEMRGKRPGAYIVGHEMGAQYLLYLNALHNQGRDVGIELSQFYNANHRQQMERLLYDLGFRVNTYSAQERIAVARVYREL